MKTLSRRSFLQASAGLCLAPQIVPARLLGANSPSHQIAVGFIGTGDHGTGWNLRRYLDHRDARVVMVCDVDRARARRAKQIVDEQYLNQDCALTKDFREVLARPDIDAVMISTPDHWHTLISVLALRAGKDVQCEKPTLTIDEGKLLMATVRKHRRVFQTSTEDRSIPVYHRMAELVRNGRIGKLERIEVSLPKQPTGPGDPTPQPVPPDLDWEMWLGPAPYAPYTKDRVHFNFRWIWDYSGGIICDWGTHLFDTAQWANDTERSGPNETRLDTNPAGEHRDFLDCVKSRKDPYFPVDIGHRVSTVCHLANIALRLGRRLKWDPQAEGFVNDAAADAMRSRPLRSPWSYGEV